MIEGVILGIVICLLIISVEIWLSTPTKTNKWLISHLRPEKCPRSEILKPQSESEKDAMKIIKKNEQKGWDTPIEDIFKE